MTPQERQMLAELFERIRSTAANPRDAEAEAFIAQATREQPYAPYVLAQAALVQRQALDAAAQRIQELEARAAPPAAPTSFLGNLGRSLFGAGQPGPGPAYDASGYQRAAPPEQPPRAPAYTTPPAGPWGAPPAAAPGGGFLAGAMTTATGVAGGVLAASAIEHLLGGHGGLFGAPAGLYGGGFGAGGLGGGETVVNNFYDSAPGAANVGLQDAGLDDGASLDSADYDGGGLDGGGGFDDGSGGGGLDV